MALRNTPQRWGTIAKLFHWTMALVVIPLWLLGKYMIGATGDLMRQYELYQLHKSVGFVVFGLAVLRLAWRACDPAPPLPAGMDRLERLAAHLSHVGFYLFLLGMPVTGFLMAAASPLGIPTVLFGTIPVPHPIAPSPELYQLFQLLHHYMGLMLALLLGVHIIAALHHHLYLKDRVLVRMIPFMR